MDIRIAALHRYPVKGLSPERLTRVQLERGAYFPADRLYAIENGPSGFDPEAPAHQSKIKFLMLMRNEGLARLRTRYLDETSELVIEHDGGEAVRARLDDEAGREAVARFFARAFSGDLKGAPRVLAAPPGFRFTDARSGYVSILNLASVRAIEDLVGAPVDPLRFRANLHVEGLEPWAEFDLLGATLAGPGGVRLTVTDRIDRCAATNVDPATGLRDLSIPHTLMRRLGHPDCGVYATISAGGALSEGERLTVTLKAKQERLPF
jgi:uncharacterized protein YcbX